jgi:hypothetical protein
MQQIPSGLRVWARLPILFDWVPQHQIHWFCGGLACSTNSYCVLHLWVSALRSRETPMRRLSCQVHSLGDGNPVWSWDGRQELSHWDMIQRQTPALWHRAVMSGVGSFTPRGPTQEPPPKGTKSAFTTSCLRARGIKCYLGVQKCSDCDLRPPPWRMAGGVDQRGQTPSGTVTKIREAIGHVVANSGW